MKNDFRTVLLIIPINNQNKYTLLKIKKIYIYIMKNVLNGNERKNGMDLAEFLLKYKDELHKTRVFYILQAKLESKDVLKFGIAGMENGDSYNRLKQYEITYGKESRRNDCKGVWVWYVGKTKFNPNVLYKNSQVKKLEDYIKNKYKTRREKERGTERIKIEPQKLINEVEKYLKGIRDEEVDVEKRKLIKTRSLQRTLSLQRQTSLLGNKKYIVEKFLKEDKTKTKIFVKWKGYDEDKSTWETINNLKQDLKNTYYIFYDRMKKK